MNRCVFVAARRFFIFNHFFCLRFLYLFYYYFLSSSPCVFIYLFFEQKINNNCNNNDHSVCVCVITEDIYMYINIYTYINIQRDAVTNVIVVIVKQQPFSKRNILERKEAVELSVNTHAKHTSARVSHQSLPSSSIRLVRHTQHTSYISYTILSCKKRKTNK